MGYLSHILTSMFNKATKTKTKNHLFGYKQEADGEFVVVDISDRCE